MSPDDKTKVEIEVAIRDGFSTVLKELGRQLGSVNKQAQDIGIGPSSAYNKFKRENDQLTESAKRSNTQFAAMGAIFTTIGRTLIGPVGLAAGVYEVAKALDGFASGRLHIRNLSTDLHLTTSQFSIMERTLKNMGMSSQEATQTISTAMSKIKDAFTRRLGSELMSDLRQMGEGEWAKKLQAVIDTGDFAKAWDMMLEKGNTGTARFKAWFSERMGIPESVIQSYKRNSEGVKAMTEADIAVLEAYHKKMNFFTDSIEDMWHKTAISIFDAMEVISKAKTLPDLMPELKTDQAKKESIYGRLRSGNWKGSGRPRDDSTKNSDSYPQGDDPMGEDYQRGETAVGKVHGWMWRRSYEKERGTRSGITDFGGRKRDESIEIENDSNKTLREIRDTLQRMESGITVSGGGDSNSGGITGGGRRGLAKSLGIDKGTSDSTSPSSAGGGHRGLAKSLGMDRGGRGGTPGVVGKTQIGKGDDPRELSDYIRETAKKYNVDPETALAVAKSEGLRDPVGDKGMSHGAFQLYKGGGLGNTFQKETGLDPADPANERATIDWALKNANKTGWGPYHGAAKTGIGPRAGLGGEAGSGDGVPSAIRDEARKVVAAGGGAEGAKQYIQSKGYNVSSAWCGDFAASVVSAAGGKPPRNYSVASNWRNFGQPVEGDPQAGDIAVRKGVRTGATGSHVTIVDQIDPETGRFKGIGGNQGRGGTRASYSLDRFDFRRGDEARERIDKTQSASQRVDANMSASIDFKNMPSWVRSSVDDNGKFKELKVTRSAPQNAKAGDGISSSSPWSYE